MCCVVNGLLEDVLTARRIVQRLHIPAALRVRSHSHPQFRGQPATLTSTTGRQPDGMQQGGPAPGASLSLPLTLNPYLSGALQARQARQETAPGPVPGEGKEQPGWRYTQNRGAGISPSSFLYHSAPSSRLMEAVGAHELAAVVHPSVDPHVAVALCYRHVPHAMAHILHAHGHLPLQRHGRCRPALVHGPRVRSRWRRASAHVWPTRAGCWSLAAQEPPGLGMPLRLALELLHPLPRQRRRLSKPTARLSNMLVVAAHGPTPCWQTCICWTSLPDGASCLCFERCFRRDRYWVLLASALDAGAFGGRLLNSSKSLLKATWITALYWVHSGGGRGQVENLAEVAHAHAPVARL